MFGPGWSHWLVSVPLAWGGTGTVLFYLVEQFEAKTFMAHGPTQEGHYVVVLLNQRSRVHASLGDIL